MLPKRMLCAGLLGLSAWFGAQAQDEVPAAPAAPVAPPPWIVSDPSAPVTNPVPVVDDNPPAESDGPKYGPTAPEDVKLLMNTGAGKFFESLGVRMYGWADSGFTFSSTGRGPLTVQPRENRFGNEYLINQLATVLERPLDQSKLSFGFNATFYAGADAELLHPLGGIETNNPRFGMDFRNLYLSAHLPVLTEGGLDVKVGRMGTIIGYESALAPYRPFYSNDYQWFYAEDGAFTGVLTNLHVTKRLDILNGITMGANTFFRMRGTGPCYLGQINWWMQEEKRTLLSASIYMGNNAIFAAPGMAGTFDTTLEVRLQHKWSDRFEQVVQTNMGWDANVPRIGTGAWYGVHNISMYHMLPKLDVNFRGEWFNDVGGTRTGFDTHYAESTLGFDFHPIKALSFRPEIRGDYAGTPVFGGGTHNAQLTLAFDVLGKF